MTITNARTEPPIPRTDNPDSLEKSANVSAPQTASAGHSNTVADTRLSHQNDADTASWNNFADASSAASSSGWLRGVVYSALFAALFVAFSYVSIPLGFTSVPITLQTLAVMLAGGLLGARYGFFSIAIVIVLAAAGLPLLHGSGGLSTVFGPTGGFIWMFPVSAFFIGLVSDQLFRSSRNLSPVKYVWLFIGLAVFGIALAYVGGVPWFAYKAELSFQAAMTGACYPFLLGDFIKAIVALLVIGSLRSKVPGLLPRR